MKKFTSDEVQQYADLHAIDNDFSDHCVEMLRQYAILLRNIEQNEPDAYMFTIRKIENQRTTCETFAAIDYTPPYGVEETAEILGKEPLWYDTYSDFTHRFVDFVRNAPVYSGVCCCGDEMSSHTSPMNDGHSPVDQWDYALSKFVEEYDTLKSS